MNDLQQLLATRGQQDTTAILASLRDGLSRTPEDSGPAAEVHKLLLGFFRIEDVAMNSSHERAFRKHPDVARQLLAWLEQDGEEQVAKLMRSLIDGKPQPLGALEQGLQEAKAQAAASQHGPAVAGALAAFAGVALGSASSAAEMELSLGWQAVEEAVLDRAQQQAAHLAFSHGPAHRKLQARHAALDELVGRMSIPDLLDALLAARNPRVLARASEWDIGHEHAPPDFVEVPVVHQPRKARPSAAAQLDDSAAAAAVKALYASSNGGALFVPTQHEPREPGLALIPDTQWQAEREHVMTWVTLGGEEAPDWARSVLPFAMLPGDAGRWVVVMEGPHAGAVMLAADDIHDEHVRYRSLAHFLAALRLFPQEIIGNGGYVSYQVGNHALYPEGYREDPPA
jgi:hypothetical protein